MFWILFAFNVISYYYSNRPIVYSENTKSDVSCL